MPLLILARGFELELLTVVALAIEGRRSSPKNIGSGESLAPVRAVSGRNEGETGYLLCPSSKKLPDAAPLASEIGLSVAQGAIWVFKAPAGFVYFDVGGATPPGPFMYAISCRKSRIVPSIPWSLGDTSGDDERKVMWEGVPLSGGRFGWSKEVLLSTLLC